MAAVITDRVNSSREPVRATCQISHGRMRRPTSSISPMNSDTCNRVLPMVHHSEPPGAAASPPPSRPAKGGSSTSTSTVAKSSITSQPTAMRPFMDARMPRASSAFSNTTVLAHESDTPNTSAAPRLQPHQLASRAPSTVATPICTTAPGMAMRLTDSRSSSEKCNPTPNISNMTPISDNCAARCTSPTNPGVVGAITIPANRYPTSAGIRNRSARKPNTRARPKPAAIVEIRGKLCSMHVQEKKVACQKRFTCHKVTFFT